MCNVSGDIEYQVGVSPVVLDLGDMERGTSTVHNFILVTESTEELLVKLTPTRGVIDFFDRPGYQNYVHNFSEEDSTEWLELLENPVIIEPLGESVGTNIGSVKGARRVNFILNVPEDAEPGYHLVMISPEPVLPKYNQNKANIVAVVAINVIFRVPGEAIRSGKILDISKGKSNERSFELRTFFENNGTVTITSAVEKLTIYDQDGSILKTFRSYIEKFEPGEVKPLISFCDYGGLTKGEYDVYSIADYHTGKAEMTSILSMKDMITGAVPQSEQGTYFPYEIIVIIIIIIVAYKIYRRN